MLHKFFAGFTIEALLLVIALLIYVLIRQTRRARHTIKGEPVIRLEGVVGEPVIRLEGVVTEIMPDGSYWVETVVEHNKHSIKCHISRKCKKLCKTIKPNDRVGIEVSPYDLTKGRIVKRL